MFNYWHQWLDCERDEISPCYGDEAKTDQSVFLLLQITQWEIYNQRIRVLIEYSPSDYSQISVLMHYSLQYCTPASALLNTAWLRKHMSKWECNWNTGDGWEFRRLAYWLREELNWMRDKMTPNHWKQKTRFHFLSLHGLRDIWLYHSIQSCHHLRKWEAIVHGSPSFWRRIDSAESMLIECKEADDWWGRRVYAFYKS